MRPAWERPNVTYQHRPHQQTIRACKVELNGLISLESIGYVLLRPFSIVAYCNDNGKVASLLITSDGKSVGIDRTLYLTKHGDVMETMDVPLFEGSYCKTDQHN